MNYFIFKKNSNSQIIKSLIAIVAALFLIFSCVSPVLANMWYQPEAGKNSVGRGAGVGLGAGGTSVIAQSIYDYLFHDPSIDEQLKETGLMVYDDSVGTHIVLPTASVFADNQGLIINKDYYQMLNIVVKVLNDYPDAPLYIIGHTHDVLPSSKQLSLTSQEAKTVSEYLLRRGIPPSRIVRIQGMGSGDKLTLDNDFDARYLNRRVEIILEGGVY